jgi:hypothetical protein
MGGTGCKGMVADPSSTGEAPTGPSRDPVRDDPMRDPTRPEAAVCDTFEPSPVQVHGAKVKYLLTGQALTDAELRALMDDPDALPPFIDAWTALPEADQKLIRFFTTAFQQEGFEAEGLATQWGDTTNRMGNVPETRTSAFDVLSRNLEESFARTALAHVREGRPFQELVTTDTFMMTTAMMVMLAFQNEASIDDAGDPRYRTLRDTIPSVRFTTASVPVASTLDPTNTNFMRFSIDDPNVVPACSGGQVTQTGAAAPYTAFKAMMGFYQRIGPADCRGTRNVRTDSLLVRADFEDWRPVRVRQPNSGEGATQFYEVEAIRAADELVVHTPRVGFFTTPAFFATWMTNEDNQARVAANQTLIVAFGTSIDPADSTFVITDDALDGEHADPSTPCYGCHRTLDPMRQFFRRDYTYAYGQQRDADVRAIGAAFAFGGVDATGDDIFAFAELVAEHPWLPAAWAQKLCYYANGAACPTGDELDRVAETFRSSGMDFRVLVRELFSSPLVTSAACIEGGTGDNAGIARARHFCHALGTRLDIADPCGIQVLWRSDRTPLGNTNAPIVTTVPDDAFSRGDQDPVVVGDVNLFVRGTFEQVCNNVAGTVVGNGRQFDPAEPAAAIGFFVEQLMGLPPSDPRHTGAREILQTHFDGAQGAGATSAVALQSTFSLACLSPSVTGMGL